jgi:hypothetical protein
VRSPRRTAILAHAGALAAAFSLAVTLVSTYVSEEAAWYVWDQAVFQDLAERTFQAFRHSTAEGRRVLAEAAAEDYNAFFALPLLPFFAALGRTRLAFELGLALAYVVPLALATGAVGTRLLRGPPAVAFWWTAAVSLFTPMTWVPGLRGYPDAGAALLVTLAVWAALGDPRLRRIPTVLAVGLALSAAVVFRRHFLFGASALMASLVVDAVWEALRLKRGARAALAGAGETVLRAVLASLLGLLAAAVLAKPAVARLLSRDFYDLYTSYLNSPAVVVQWFVPPYGWLGLAGALAGYVLAWRTGTFEPRAARLLLIFGALSALQWIAVVRQIGEQYTLHFTLTVVVGLSALGWTLWQRAHGVRRALVACAAAYLAVNLYAGVSSSKTASDPVPLRDFLAANWAPLVRDEGVGPLVDALRRLALHHEAIAVVASSLTMSGDLLRNADRSRYNIDRSALDFVRIATVDSRDPYPLEPLVRAQLVVHVTPLQLHLARAEQEQLAAVHDLFAEGAGLAADFRAVAKPFPLDDGVRAVVFRRERPTAFDAGLRTLRYLQARVPRPSAAQAPWVVVSGRFPVWVENVPGRGPSLVWHPVSTGDPAEPVAVYLPAPPDHVRASGNLTFVDGRCPGVRAVFSFRAAGGGARDVAVVARRPGEDGRFTAVFDRPRGADLLLRLRPRDDGASIDHCLVKIESLDVQDAGAEAAR